MLCTAVLGGGTIAVFVILALTTRSLIWRYNRAMTRPLQDMYVFCVVLLISREINVTINDFSTINFLVSDMSLGLVIKRQRNGVLFSNWMFTAAMKKNQCSYHQALKNFIRMLLLDSVMPVKESLIIAIDLNQNFLLHLQQLCQWIWNSTTFATGYRNSEVV